MKPPDEPPDEPVPGPGALVPADGITAPIRLALEHVLGSLDSEHSRSAYRSDWMEWLTWCTAAGLVATQAKPADVFRYVQELKATQARKSIARKLSSMRQVYAALVVGGVCPTNPAREVKTPRVEGGPRTPWLDKDALAALLTPRGTSWRARRDHMLIVVLAGLGWRRAEVARLRWDKMRPMQFTAGERAGQEVLVVTLVVKGGKTNEVAVPELVADLLRVWHPSAEGAWVFPSHEGAVTHVAPNTVNAVVKRTAIEAGIEPERITAQALRRTFATIATLAGTPLRELQAAMGHASSSTTEGYVKAAQTMTHAPGDAVFRSLAEEATKPKGGPDAG